MGHNFYVPGADLALRTSIKAHNTAKRKAKGKRKSELRKLTCPITSDNAPAWLLDAINCAIRSGKMQPGKTYTFHNKATDEYVYGVGLYKVGA